MNKKNEIKKLQSQLNKKVIIMMEQRQNSNMYPANLTDLLAVSAYQQNVDRLSAISDGEDKYTGEFTDNTDRFAENADRSSSPVSTLDDGDSQSAFGVDLTGKGTNLGGKSFTIAAILGLTNRDDDVMNLSVQERLQQNQRQLHNYLYAGHDVQRLNDGFCRSMVDVPTGLRQGKVYFFKLYTNTPLQLNSRVSRKLNTLNNYILYIL